MLARDAKAALETPFGQSPAHRAALALLAGDMERAAEPLADLVPDGRELLLTLVQACLAELAPGLLAAPPVAPVPAALLEALPARELLVLALASEVAPWRLRLARLHALTRPCKGGLAPRARGPGLARARLGARPCGSCATRTTRTRIRDATVAVLAWLRVRAKQADHQNDAEVRDAEITWLAASGRTSADDPSLAPWRPRAADPAGATTR